MTANNKIPVTILTGALGAGKTTLIKNLLAQMPDKKVLIVENEFAEVSIDSKILEDAKKEVEIVELSNGCICCNIRGDLVASLLKIAKEGEQYDRVIIECTGVADPSQIAGAFAPLSVLSSKFIIDATLCLVDAKNHFLSKKNEEIYIKQIVFSDRILISKKDIVIEEEYLKVKDDIMAMHPSEQFFDICNGEIESDKILGLYCYTFKNFKKDNGLMFETKTLGHSYKSHVLKFNGLFERSKLEFFFNVFYLTHYEQVVRTKGILCFKDIMQKVFFHAVYDQFSFSAGEAINLGDDHPESVLIFIGKDINEEYLKIGLEQCLIK